MEQPDRMGPGWSGGAAGSDGPGRSSRSAAVDGPASPVLTVRAAFERDLLAAAEGRTAAGFGRRARRLRESRFPDLIPVRHRQAKDKRRVMFQPLPDGMSCLSAIIAAEKGQAMFAALTGAAKAGKRAGDPRTMDQLRADTLTELLLTEQAGTTSPPRTPQRSSRARTGDQVPQAQVQPTRFRRLQTEGIGEAPPVPSTNPAASPAVKPMASTRPATA